MGGGCVTIQPPKQYIACVPLGDVVLCEVMTEDELREYRQRALEGGFDASEESSIVAK